MEKSREIKCVRETLKLKALLRRVCGKMVAIKVLVGLLMILEVAAVGLGKGKMVGAATVKQCGDYEYQILTDGTAEICGYKGKGGNIVIPAKVNGVKVSKIGALVFFENKSITGVTIENGITEIGERCFERCENNEYVYMTDSVTTLGDSVFSCNEKLSKVRLSNNISVITEYCFFICASLEHIVLPDKLTYIDAYAFTWCDKLSEIYLPDGVEKIESFAFELCKNLKWIRVSPNLAVIGEETFEDTPKDLWFTTVDLRKVQISPKVPRINVFPYKTVFGLCDHEPYTRWYSGTFVIKSNYVSITGYPFTPEVIFYGVPGTEVETYANSNGNAFHEYIAAKSIAISATQINLVSNRNNTYSLSYKVYPQTATIPHAGYYSSNPKVAKVDGEGKVTALQAGKAVITAVSLDDPSIMASCHVNVSTALTGITLSKKTLTLQPGTKTSYKLTAKPIPGNTTQWKPSWSSSNKKIATVDGNGKVTGIYPGSAVITVQSGSYKASCKVTILPKQVSGFKMKSQTNTSIKVQWKAVKGASGYRIYLYDKKTKKYKKLTDCKSSVTSYTLKKINKKKLQPGTAYALSIRAYKKIGNSKYYGSTQKLKVATKPSKPKTIRVIRQTKGKKRGWKVSWSKVSGVTGYQVYVSTNKGKTYRLITTIKGSSRTTYTWLKGKRKTTYYIKVRGYKTAGTTKVKGTFSSKRFIRIY